MSINKNDFKCCGPFKLWTIENFPFIEADFDAITNYQLYSKIVEYVRKIAENQNALNNSYNELIEAFNNLESYVENYFENLDVQEEINNKLDEMAESGQLDEIIAQYIELRGQLTYNTVNEMKEAENIVDGSFLKTYGFYEYNDGGGALYKARPVTNEDDVDNITIIPLNNPLLIGELVSEPQMNLLQFGAKGDNTTLNTEFIQTAINYCCINKIKLFIPDGIFLTGALSCPAYIEIFANNSTLKANSDSIIENILYSENKLKLNGLSFDSNNVANYGLKLNGFDILIENCYFKNSIKEGLYSQGKENIYDNATINNCIFDTAGGGIKIVGYPYEDSEDYKGSISFNNCKTINECGNDEDLRLYMFMQLDYVEINGGDFTGYNTNATNVYKTNYCIIKGGYYHDCGRGVTTGKITKNVTISDVIVKNVSEGAGIHIDAVTDDRIYPEINAMICNNIIINAYRGAYIQGKKVHMLNNSITCGNNLASSGGIIRINNEDTTNSDCHIFIDKLYLYNDGYNTTPIYANDSIITLGDDIYIQNKSYASIDTSLKILKFNTVEINSNYYISPVDKTIIVDATDNLVELFLPKQNDAKIIGNRYLIIRKDSSAYNVNLRTRSNGGSINGVTGSTITLTNKITEVVQVGNGEYIINS